jgi:hypothetical protein
MEAGGTVEVTVYARRVFGAPVFTVPSGPPLPVQGPPRPAVPLGGILQMASGSVSRVAELLNLLWGHESSKEGLCDGGKWWPEEVTVTLCDGRKQDANKVLAVDAELPTHGNVFVTVLRVERKARSASDKRPLRRMRPKDWRAVQSLAPAEAVAQIRGLQYGITETHLNAKNYCDKRKVHFAGAYSTTVPDLRMVPYLTTRADALASPAAAVRPLPELFLPSRRTAAFKLYRKDAGVDGACRELDGGRVFHVRDVLTEEQVLEATEAAMGATYERLETQPTGHRLLSRQQQNQHIQSAVRIRAERLRSTRCEVRWYTFLLTLPLCPEQIRHLDHKDPRVWSMIIGLGVNRRLVWFRVGGELVPVFVGRGEAVFFQGNVCHYGGASTTPCGCPSTDRCMWVDGEVAADLRCLELGLHAYVVMEDEGGAVFDWAALGQSTNGCD